MAKPTAADYERLAKPARLPRDFIAFAPCYWQTADDGATWRCHECNERGPASSMFTTLTPNGGVAVMHKTCVDQDWLANAKQMDGSM